MPSPRGSVCGELSHTQKVAGLISGEVTYLGTVVGGLILSWGACRRQPIDVSLSPHNSFAQKKKYKYPQVRIKTTFKIMFMNNIKNIR